MLGTFAMSRRVCSSREALVEDVLGVRVQRRQRADGAEKMPIGWAS